MQSTMIERSGENGAALIVALLILLVLTLLGVTAMQTTTLQERMAGHSTDQELAFQAAEAALRRGERSIHTVSHSSADRPRLHGDHDGDRTAWLAAWKEMLDGQQSHPHPDNVPNVSRAPRFVIHELGPAMGPAGQQSANEVVDDAFGPASGGTTPDHMQYSVTAIGYGQSQTGYVILQSIVDR